MMVCLTILMCACVLGTVGANPMPIIGVLSQESFSIDQLFPSENYKSFIAASYVKFLESAGARVLPIWIGRDKDYYKKVVENTNGIFLPGGAVWFNQSNGFADAGQMLYDAALKANENNDFYPVWGTCLGMELLLQVALGGQEIRAHCDSKKISMPLEFVEDFKKSKLFEKAPDAIIDILKRKNVTVNYHMFCVTEKNMSEHRLLDDWRILSKNKDINGLEFVSSYEHRKYPFYGVQFHPEKNPFEFKPSQAKYVDHSLEAILASQYFADFFVEQTRKCNHRFESWKEEQKRLIYNYPPRFSGPLGSSYQQVYAFTADDNNS